MKKVTSLKVGKKYVVYQQENFNTFEVTITKKREHSIFSEWEGGASGTVTTGFTKDITLKRFLVWHYPCVVICEL